jgi:hypothetical protein
MITFKNTSNKKEAINWKGEIDPSFFGFDDIPRGLSLWARLFQCVVSQATTFKLKKEFHNFNDCGIHKYEGGCIVDGFEVVLLKERCYINYGTSKKTEAATASMVTEVVLGWDPMDPIESMLDVAAKASGCNKDSLSEVINKTGRNNPFSANPLTRFFDMSFSGPKEDREYERFCLETITATPKEKIDQMFSDRDLGTELLEKLQNKARSIGSLYIPLCCSPKREGDNLSFWINTGSNTNIDKWRTEEEIRGFINDHNLIIKKETYGV